MQVKWWRSGFFYILLIVVVVALILTRVMSAEGPTPVSLPEFTESAKQGQIDTIRQKGEMVEGLESEQVIITTHFDGTTYDLLNFFRDEGVVLGVEGEGKGV